jgi:hypothetical protein
MALLTALTIGSLVVGAYESYKAGQAAKKSGEAGQAAANSQADLADYNAAVADVQAQDAVTRGAQEEARFRSGVRGMVGTQRAGFAAGNIDVGSGSAVDVQADTAYLGELDALQIKTNAAREAWGFTIQAQDLRKRAEIARKTGVFLEATGRTQATTAYIGGATSLVTGAANLYSAKYGFGGGSGNLQSRPTVPTIGGLA